MKNKKTRLFIIIAILSVTALTIAFSIHFIRFINQPGKLREFIDSLGILSPIIYILLTFIQILVPIIPGELF